MKITPRKYAQALVELLEKNEDAAALAHIKNFLKLLRRRNQFKLLSKVVASFEAQWIKRQGITKVDAWYPEKFADSPKILEEGLKKSFGDKLILNVRPAKNLLGGYKIRMGDLLIDATIAGRLRALTSSLSPKS